MQRSKVSLARGHNLMIVCHVYCITQIVCVLVAMGLEPRADQCWKERRKEKVGVERGYTAELECSRHNENHCVATVAPLSRNLLFKLHNIVTISKQL